MSDINKFPGLRWAPSGECRVFNSADDVPEGWRDSHPDNWPAPVPASFDMERKDIVAALNAGGIAFVKNAKTEALYAQLTEAVKAHLTESGVEFDPASSVKALLELTNAPE